MYEIDGSEKEEEKKLRMEQSMIPITKNHEPEQKRMAGDGVAKPSAC